MDAVSDVAGHFAELASGTSETMFEQLMEDRAYLTGETVTAIHAGLLDRHRPGEDWAGHRRALQEFARVTVYGLAHLLVDSGAPLGSWLDRAFADLSEHELAAGTDLHDLRTACVAGYTDLRGRLAWAMEKAGEPEDGREACDRAVAAYLRYMATGLLDAFRAARGGGGPAAATPRELARGHLLDAVLAPDLMWPGDARVRKLAKAAWAGKLPAKVTAVALLPGPGAGRPGLPEQDQVLADLAGAEPFLLAPGAVDEAAAARLAGALPGYRIVISLEVPLRLAGRSLDWARLISRAPDRIAPGTGAVVRACDHVRDLFMLTDPALSERALRRYRERFEDSGLRHYEDVLLDMVAPWLRRESCAQIAAQLGIGEQAVENSIAEVTAILGDDLGDLTYMLGFQLFLRELELERQRRRGRQ